MPQHPVDPAEFFVDILDKQDGALEVGHIARASQNGQHAESSTKERSFALAMAQDLGCAQRIGRGLTGKQGKGMVDTGALAAGLCSAFRWRVVPDRRD